MKKLTLLLPFLLAYYLCYKKTNNNSIFDVDIESEEDELKTKGLFKDIDGQLRKIEEYLI
ncbi:hypothetical protein [Staphylococcus pseudintermedius]|uniref:hypothetical protein n=1 Tax=Staphylococcus pseudintermedius TaxID=283734 RepID=UPI001441156D|nr:hypothetical protein [Staphylococcus pseudintermedius]EGQ1611820.1 hypothetical protein [Staphylococcus pseudintermedius]EGQ3357509.1 hypothetical protein [Staphylococcus pseudintermedius]EGQ3365094.1 hypothetical protein [Staphylococcus pseudintermedius]EGQ3434056.1 hypothetical protein [Staphylococcus pseudintermedius]EGQ3752033.1 hypothetical protein [Staphylococcus pseudintermedius]